ncbi:MAG: uroporphyrinogen-III C-methyltransferase [Thermodesulfobacteria bacterium]|nr:uroporphyrinogen-III C-methyltransferase [Thermodesulfobacteriota bacterium]
MQTEKKGKVYLVGAGPGDPGLLTLRGKELIEKAEVIIYDRLASPRIMEFANPDAEKIYVGKRVGKHVANQQEINDLILQKAKEGKRVVRLKGGDPFIFGRGGEEAQILASHGIPFEIVPGVTSAIAVPAYAGIPLTHRSYTASVAFITGHRRFDTKEADVDWEGLAKGVGTLVFLMGMTNLPNIVDNLIRFGRSPDTPVAIIRWGTTPLQESLTGTLSDIVSKVKEAGFRPPAIIVVGDVCKVREDLNWFEKQPLLGKKVLVTRTRQQASELVRLLERKGAGCIECPTIEVRQVEDLSILDDAIKNASNFDWIIFTSPNAVKFFFLRVDQLGMDVRALGNAKIATVGSSTAKALEQHHIRVDAVPDDFRAEGLLEFFSKKDMTGKKVLIPRAVKAREILPEGLREMGAEVVVAPAYETVPPQVAPQTLELLEDEKIDVVTFTSSSTVNNFFKAVPEHLVKKVMDQAKIACIGPVTAKTAEKRGLKVDILPEKSTIPSMVEAIEKSFSQET